MLNHKGTHVIETRRLILRRFTVADAPAMYRNWASDPEVTKFLTWQPHSSVEATAALLAAWVESYKEESTYQWAITLREQPDEPIGSISVVSINETVDAAEIGYCLSKSWWHRGIMSEALQGVIDYLFDEVGMNRISALHDSNNPHSGAVMQKCGMQYEGTLRQSTRSNQGITDACHYAILATDRRHAK